VPALYIVYKVFFRSMQMLNKPVGWYFVFTLVAAQTKVFCYCCVTRCVCPLQLENCDLLVVCAAGVVVVLAVIVVAMRSGHCFKLLNQRHLW